MTETDEGLNKVVTLSDSLNYYTWNEYAEGEPLVAPGKSRAATEDKAEEGHVKLSRKFIDKSLYGPTPEEFVEGARSIHIEFSLADVYPPFQLARIIVHEATHKFAGTSDHAYTYEEDYEDLDYRDRVFNANSYAYVVISIALNMLIKNEEQLFGVVPQDYQRPPKKVRSPIQEFVGAPIQKFVEEKQPAARLRRRRNTL